MSEQQNTQDSVASQFEGFPDEDNAREQVVEAALFASDQPLTLERLQLLFGEDQPVSRTEVRAIISRLQAHNEQRGIELVKVAGGFRFQTKRGLHPWLARLWDEKPRKYSRALMETLALIAYRQPITRSEIEDVRGVSVASNIIRTLLEREWVRVVGHRDVPGRPALFATTPQFLDYFSLESLDSLPPLSEIKSMAELEPELDLETGMEQSEESSSFAGMLNRLQEDEDESDDDNLDASLSDQWESLDELNDQFESSIRSRSAADDQDSEIDTQEPAEGERVGQEPQPDSAAVAEDALTEAEKFDIIQQKLAEQANLIKSGGNDNDTETGPETSGDNPNRTETPD
ncbi:MAG: SMC-Scp complex subunit ScpB [Natronospirillum sp.]|uniref:SMC-Scp complex subunit ScpB n=1 Tax=Natronospirillum sp. TaxID=2812955 RepID=UPI0025EF2142|nr:SMC-Scp complex subunit ScpB [Natronospirillum sp.]MCH8551847.1 SMC-Scp complex subunit ScpB [Natronospirillum sp.]